MCTSILAGKKATANKIVIIARNEDADTNNWNKYLVYRPVPEYHKDSNSSNALNSDLWRLGNGLQVPVPNNQFAYTGMPDARAYFEAEYNIGDRFFYEERGINERNVAISATNSLTTNKKASKADPFVTEGGISEPVIPTLLLPQSNSAKHAVRLLGKYVEKYGASEPNGILIADIKGAWYFEIGSGHHWIATRVPKDSYMAVANGMRTHGVDLDSKTVRHSKGVFEFVKKHNLLKDPDRHHFNFAEAFGIPGVPYNTDRIWLAQKILTSSRVQKPRQFQYPMFLKPDEAIKVADVMQVLRATYKGTVLQGKARRPIGVDRTAESHIITLAPFMPYELQGLIWQCVGAPLGGPYMPLYAAMKEVPQAYGEGNDEYDSTSAWWAFRGLYAISGVYRKAHLPDLKRLWSGYEKQWLSDHPGVNSLLKKMYKSSKSMAIDFAGQYSSGIASLAVDTAHKERDKVVTRITVAQGPNTLPKGEGEV